MIVDAERVKAWVVDMALLIEQHQDPAAHYYGHFTQEPELAAVLIELIDALDEQVIDEDNAYYSACVFALDVCVAQLQSGLENGNKRALHTMELVMKSLAALIRSNQHTLVFWLPILNIFYDVHAQLSFELKEAYLDLVHDDEDRSVHQKVTHLNSLQDVIHELADLSVFDMAENFFAQSYAMPADFFADLLVDLYSINEGAEVGLLSLLHPDTQVRETVLATLDELMPSITLSSVALSRLQAIKLWYPSRYHTRFEHWIKEQRKKGVVFHVKNPAHIMSVRASEVDGGGAQGLFIHVRRGREHRLGGLLLKVGFGIKDAWITPVMKADEVRQYYHDVFDDTVMLRPVDVDYLQLMVNHFLSITVNKGSMCDLHLLEIQEETGLQFVPMPLDMASLMDELSVKISPFTHDVLQAALKSSQAWVKKKSFTDSWYLESAEIDQLVNRCCSMMDGVRVCQFSQATTLLFAEIIEQQRQRWVFHFLWVALWLKAKSRKHETMWRDSFLIAHAIQTGTPMAEIPIMHDIVQNTIVNSIDTMHERRTHLN